MLRGLGVTMALPWLESLRVWGDDKKSEKASSEAPVRCAVLFAGNGFHSKEWWAKGEGKNLEVGKVLESLGPHREKLLFVQGLYNVEATKGNIHSSQTGAGCRRRDPLGHELRPASRADLRAFDEGSQPRARLRSGESVGPQELLDAL
jgi:hypothetical protein